MPHVGGDEPEHFDEILEDITVCPTYVGMNRPSTLGNMSRRSMPYVGGDEPKSSAGIGLLIRYTPHVWG